MATETRFAFGKNWAKYLAVSSNKEILEKSKKSLNDFLAGYLLKGKTFLDFGSGSGVHSLAALSLGASKVASIDFDDDSVACARHLKEKSQSSNWEIKQGSLLDENLIKSLGQFDVVYCWGVAHHTGDMAKALENLEKLIAPRGLLFLAIYNKVEGKLGSRYWWHIKRFYNESGFIVKKIMETAYLAYNFLMLVARFKNPLRVFSEYKKKRGMSWSTDLIDWLGGFPYEYASVKEIFDLYHGKYGMELLNIKTTNYTGCNQFLFSKK
ncbi:MAG: class I SAM-dependent methyltransferase [Candidatus Paceibacterota bacterium]